MIQLLYGQDTYRSREELRKIIEEYKKANPAWLDFVRIDASKEEVDFFEQVHRSADTISMFNQGKLIIIENIFLANREVQDNILDFLKKRNFEKDKDITIVFWEGESLPRAESRGDLFKFLKSKIRSQEFKPLRGYQLKNWIKDCISQQKGKIENLAVEKLIEYIGSDLWRMANELNKLISYKIRDTKYEIRVGDIELLVKPEIDLNIFEMVDALGYKNKDKVLKLFNQFLEKREDEVYLLTMFIYQIRNLIKLKDLLDRNVPYHLLAKEANLHPFTIKKTVRQLRNFTLTPKFGVTSRSEGGFTFKDLKKIYYQLLTIDFDIKTGRVDSRTALELFLARL